MKKIILIVSLLFSSLSFADRASDMQRLREHLLQQQQRLRQMFDDDFFKDDFSHFDKVFKDFFGDRGFDDDFFTGPGFGQFFKQLRPFDHMGSGQAHWINTPNERTLVLKIKTQKDAPVDINIKDGVVTIKADIKEVVEHKDPQTGAISKSISMSSYNNSFSVPDDCDANKAQIENKNGEIVIHFPKRKISGGGTIKTATPQKDDRQELKISGGKTI
jgi:HSP20 family molecular chaperone IbpA